MEYNFTKDFSSFVGMLDLNWQEIYELYQAAIGNTEALSIFKVEKANGSSDDTIIFFPALEQALRLTPSAKDFFPEWIEKNLMDGLDAETFWGIKNAEENHKND